MDRQQLIQQIEDYSARTGLAPSTITGRAVNNSRLFKRMVDGGDCTTKIAAKLVTYMAENPAEKASEGAA
jgi:hypothetical protein